MGTQVSPPPDDLDFEEVAADLLEFGEMRRFLSEEEEEQGMDYTDVLQQMMGGELTTTVVM